MFSETRCSGPVAIGGLGGSGTRVVAEILLTLGFYMGGDLNRAHDNLWFTLLFRNPRWFAQCSANKESQIFRGLRIFENVMTDCLRPKISDVAFILRAAIEYHQFRRRHQLGKNQRVWSISRTLLRPKTIDRSRYAGWGWKAPINHIYLQYLIEHFHQLKYIHVIRHGLDMAYSGNQNQLYHWGFLFDLPLSNSPELLPGVSLMYWIKANEKAITLGRHYLGERFLVINFDELCSAPDIQVSGLVKFLGLDEANINMNKLYDLPERPASTGRYKEHDISIFDRRAIDAVRRSGFEVEE